LVVSYKEVLKLHTSESGYYPEYYLQVVGLSYHIKGFRASSATFSSTDRRPAHFHVIIDIPYGILYFLFQVFENTLVIIISGIYHQVFVIIS